MVKRLERVFSKGSHSISSCVFDSTLNSKNRDYRTYRNWACKPSKFWRNIKLRSWSIFFNSSSSLSIVYLVNIVDQIETLESFRAPTILTDSATVEQFQPIKMISFHRNCKSVKCKRPKRPYNSLYQLLLRMVFIFKCMYPSCLTYCCT